MCALGDTYVPLCFPQCYGINIVIPFYTSSSPRLLPFLLARVYQHPTMSINVIQKFFLALGGLHEDKSCDTLQAMDTMDKVDTVASPACGLLNR